MMEKTCRNPKISIITVCYNCETGIEGTVKSVVNQTYSNVEYIIIDGQSTDKSIDIIKKYSNSIVRIVSEKDDGIYNAMNKGIDICTGDYVMFLNGGDCLYNKTVLADVVEKYNGQDIIYGNLMLGYNNGTYKMRSQPEVINKFLFINSTILHPASFIKRGLFQKYGKFDEKYAVSADFDFFLRVVFIPEVSLLYLPLVISIFNMGGASNNPKTFTLRHRDRLEIQKKNLPCILYFIAKVRFFLMSRLDQYISRQLLRCLNKALRFARNN